MDPLSHVLSLLKLNGYNSVGFDAGGAWLIAFAPHDGIKFYAALSGECWLWVDGVEGPVRVVAGDCIMLPRGRACRFGSDPDVPPADAIAIFSAITDGSVYTYQGGGDFFGVGGYFSLDGANAEMLVSMLPPLLHINDESDRVALRWCAERLRQELRAPKAGSTLVAQQLVTMMLVAALRVYVEQPTTRVGWLFALSDPHMAAAIGAMHESPQQRWTVSSLAKLTGMSRTAFANTFKATVGTAPMEYLMRWRMMIACDRLTGSRDSIADIAEALGYQSESAFSTAFKRINGYSPRTYARATTPA